MKTTARAAGLCAPRAATCAVALPAADAFAGMTRRLEDLSPGLNRAHARGHGARGRDARPPPIRDRSKRFQYVTVCQTRPGELLAILADGTSFLLARPVGEQTTAARLFITLGSAAESAVLALASGRELTLRALLVAPHSSATNGRPSSPPLNGSSPPLAIDGARLGARLRELRVAAGLTQAELARRTGIHRPNIARVEAGRHTPSLETLARLASAIGVPTTSVLAES